MEHVHGVDIFDIYDINYEPWWLQTWFWILSGVIVLLCVSVIGFYVYKYKSKKALTYPEQVLKKVYELRSSADDIENAHNFYAILTDILKEYLTHTYSIASGCTDEELLHAIQNTSDVSSEVIDATQEILNGIDSIKFGKGAAVSDAMHKALFSMQKIVEVTIKRS